MAAIGRTKFVNSLPLDRLQKKWTSNAGVDFLEKRENVVMLLSRRLVVQRTYVTGLVRPIAGKEKVSRGV